MLVLKSKRRGVRLAALVLSPFIIWTAFDHFNMGNRNSVKLQGAINYTDMSNMQVPWTYDERFKNPCWYEKDVLQCLPYYFIIGVKKCGTSAIYRHLMQHPESIKLAFKEQHFFAGRNHVNTTYDIRDYIRLVSEGATKIEQNSRGEKSTNSVNKLIFCDASTTNLQTNFRWEVMPGNIGLKEPKYIILDYIHKFLPKAKMIMAVRDPVDRLYSDYYFSLELNNQGFREMVGPKHFHKLVVKAVYDYRICLNDNSERFCVYNSTLKVSKGEQSIFRYGLSLSSGMYYVFMNELLRLYPREQIFLAKSKEIGSRDMIGRLFEFLEMSPASESVWERIMRRKFSNIRDNYYKSKGPMLKTTQKLLYEFYKPFNKRMAALTGDDDFLFKMPGLE